MTNLKISKVNYGYVVYADGVQDPFVFSTAKDLAQFVYKHYNPPLVLEGEND
jgi:hypothetical protein